MIKLEKAELKASVHHIEIFKNQENRFTIAKCRQKNTGNCKALCVPRKRKKKTSTAALDPRHLQVEVAN